MEARSTLLVLFALAWVGCVAGPSPHPATDAGLFAGGAADTAGAPMDPNQEDDDADKRADGIAELTDSDGDLAGSADGLGGDALDVEVGPDALVCEGLSESDAGFGSRSD